jgi:hypothetical protein
MLSAAAVVLASLLFPFAPTSSASPVRRKAVDCVSRSVIDGLGPDGLPPVAGVVTSRREDRRLIRTYAHQIRTDYPGVVRLSTGPGWGRAWTEVNGTVEVVPVRDYAIIATVAHASRCPDIPGFGAGLNGATIFFRHL